VLYTHLKRRGQPLASSRRMSPPFFRVFPFFSLSISLPHMPRLRALLAPLAFTLLTFGCGNSEKTPPPSPSATPSVAPPPPQAPKSPLSVVLESHTPITFSGLANGVVVADAARTKLATAVEGGELASNSMPTGLPADGEILRFAGRLPSSVWVLFEEPKVDKNPAKNPFFRWERSKGSFKSYADDWKPLLTAWTKNRILSVSTSSGKLKVKVLEPYTDKPSPDQPSAKLDDEACAKSLRIEAISALASGEVFAAGHCNASGSGRKTVVVRWAEPKGIQPPAVSASASAGKTQDPPADAADAGTSDAGAESAEPIGLPGSVFVAKDAPGSLKITGLVAQGPGDVWLLGTEEGGAAKLYRLDGGDLKAQALPNLGVPVRAIAGASDGTLWLVSERAIWKRFPPGEWEEIPPPSGQWAEPDPRWEMFGVWAGGGDVWIAGKHTSSKAERHVVLRLREAKELVKW